MNLSSQLRVIAARLCKSEDTQIDGRQLLAFADEAASLESYRAEVCENAEELLMLLNDQLNTTRGLVDKLTVRPKCPVDGNGPNKPGDNPQQSG